MIKTLIDTGPIVGLIDCHDPNHKRCKLALQKIPEGEFITTWPCFTEAMYLLSKAAGYPAQSSLWKYIEDDLIKIASLNVEAITKMQQLMARYRDTPMDLADASLIAAADMLKIDCIFTLDSDFYIYRIENGGVMEVIP